MMHEEQWQSIPHLRQELKLLEDYLELQKTNFNEKKYSFTVFTDGLDIEYCIQSIIKLKSLLRMFENSTLSFSNVFVSEFIKLSKSHIIAIRKDSNEYSQEKLLSHSNLIVNLVKSFKNNAFLISDPLHISTILNTTHTVLPNNLKSYLNVGKNSLDDPRVDEIINELAQLKFAESDLNPSELSFYASIIGPSFLGKTQMAFTLSHKINVFYVNLLSANLGDRAAVKTQAIYTETNQIAELFEFAIIKDLDYLIEREIDANILFKYSAGFYTLGLLYVLIRNGALNPNQSAEQRFLELINVKELLAPRLTACQFKNILRDDGIDLDKQLVFIDEMPRLRDDKNFIYRKIKFLRNLSRAANLPSLLCGTNTDANNLIGNNDVKFTGYGEGSKKWVKALVKLISACIKSLCCNLKSGSLAMSDFVSSDGSSFNIDSFFTVLIGNDSVKFPVAETNKAKKLLAFVFEKSKVGLPGIVYSSVKFIFEYLIAVKNGESQLEKLWILLAQHLRKCITIRKKGMYEKKALLASVHILTLPNDIKAFNEIGEVASEKVNEHFFYFGKCNDSSFDLVIKNADASPITINRRTGERNIFNVTDDNRNTGNNENSTIENDGVITQLMETSDQTSENVIMVFQQSLSNARSDYVLYRNEEIFVNQCHFTSVYDDFFLCYALWNLWYEVDEKRRWTLAALYQDYLKAKSFPVLSAQSVPDFFSLELLAHWSVAYASHTNSYGKTKGMPFMTEFMINVQKLVDDNCQLDKKFNIVGDSEELRGFLDKITVPYLICGPPKDPIIGRLITEQADDPAPSNATIEPSSSDISEAAKIERLIKKMAPFVNLGTCHRPKNSMGWDVLFDMQYDNLKETGFVECKLWSSPVGLSLIYPYYEKACVGKYKLSLLVASDWQISLKKLGRKLTPQQREFYERAVKTTGKRRLEELSMADITEEIKEFVKNENTHVDKLNKLWSTGQNKINIYAVKFESEKCEGSHYTGKFICHTLKEHENPDGIFIIIQSSFRPLPRSGSS